MSSQKCNEIKNKVRRTGKYTNSTLIIFLKLRNLLSNISHHIPTKIYFLYLTYENELTKIKMQLNPITKMNMQKIHQRNEEYMKNVTGKEKEASTT